MFKINFIEIVTHLLSRLQATKDITTHKASLISQTNQFDPTAVNYVAGASNFVAAAYMVSLFVGLKIIESSTTKRDRRFKLGYNPMSMSWKGYLLTILWVVIWFYGTKLFY